MIGRIKHLFCRKASNLIYRLQAAALARRTWPKHFASATPKTAVPLTLIVCNTAGQSNHVARLQSIANALDVDGVQLIWLTDDPNGVSNSSPDNQSGNRVTFEILATLNPESPAAGLAQARGQFIAVLAPDCLLVPSGLRGFLAAVGEKSGPLVAYTDAVVCGEEPLGPGSPVLKPAYDPVLLDDIDYVSDLVLYSEDVFQEIGRQAAVDETDCLGLFRHAANSVGSHAVLHLAFPVVRSPHAPRPVSAVACGNLQPLERAWPPITAIIPNKDSYTLIKTLLDGIFMQTDYPALIVLVVDNGTDDPRVLDLYDKFAAAHTNFQAHVKPEKFNFSSLINRGLDLAGSGHVLLLNNDIEITHADWLKELVSCLDYEDTGIVGAKLLFPDDTLQHAGVTVGIGGLASHRYYKCPSSTRGHFGRLTARNSLLCVTGAVMLISDACRARVGRFNEDDFAVAYNDVDYCLRAHSAGFRVVWTPYACLYHHESVSRGKDRSRSRKAQFEREKRALREIHGTGDLIDPSTSPWLAPRSGPFRFRLSLPAPALRSWWGKNS